MKNKEYDYRLCELIPNYELLKKQARENLLSSQGIEIKINKSIQVEVTFVQIKQNMNYDRIRRRGLEKVSCEVTVSKYFVLLNQDNIKGNYWEKPLNLKKEKISFPKQKVIKKKLNKNYLFLLSPFFSLIIFF